MKTNDLIRYYGTRAAAVAAIGYTKSIFSHWEKAHGGVVPAQAAVLFCIASCHRLQMGWEDYANQLPSEQKQAA